MSLDVKIGKGEEEKEKEKGLKEKAMSVRQEQCDILVVSHTSEKPHTHTRTLFPHQHPLTFMVCPLCLLQHLCTHTHTERKRAREAERERGNTL